MPVQYYLNLYGGEIFLKGTVYLIGEEANLRLLTNAMSCLIDLTGLTACPEHIPQALSCA